MSERVVITQNSDYETQVLATDPEQADSSDLYPVEHIHELTPYHMLLASLGTCTAVVLHTYAQYHSVPLQEVVIDLVYDRIFGEDCEKCEGIDEYDERIKGTVSLRGELTEDQRHRLHAVSRHCPIHKMLQTGIGVDVAFVDGGV